MSQIYANVGVIKGIVMNVGGGGPYKNIQIKKAILIRLGVKE